MDDRVGRRNRRARAFSLVVGVALVGVRVGVLAHSWTAGVGAGLAVVLLNVGLIVWSRRRAERRLADNVGPGPVEGLLDFASLPTDWRTKARETLGAIGGTNAPGMSVMMSAADGYLVLQRRMLKFTGKTPFTARVPLGAVESVKVGRPQLGLIGSSLVFTLSTGEEIRVDVAVGEDSAELIAEVFRQAPARPGDGLTQPPASAIEITSPEPPIRTSAGRVYLLLLAWLPPWSMSMIGAHDGPWAAAAASGGLFLALGLMMGRPRWASRVSAWVMVGAGLGFAADGIALGDDARFAGTLACLLLATWMASVPPVPAQPAPDPAWFSPMPGADDEHRAGTSRRGFALAGVVAAVVGLVVLIRTMPDDTRTATAGAAAGASADGPSVRPVLTADGDPVYIPPSRALPTADPGVRLPAVLTAPRLPDTVIDPATAAAVTRSLWDLRGEAIEAHDTRLMAAFETGPALELDAGRCACSGTRNPFGKIAGLAISVLRQTSFPASFLAEVSTTESGKPYLCYLVVARASETSPWQVAFAGGFSTEGAATVSLLPFDDMGFLAEPTAPPLAEPLTLHARLAAYWREAKRTARVPAPGVFAAGRWTTGFAKVLTVHHQGATAVNGLVAYYAYETDAAHDPTYVFPAAGGWRIVCGVIRVQKTYVGRHPGHGPHQDAGRRNWGSSVPPGNYRAVIVTEITVPCMEVPPAGSGDGVHVLGASEYDSATEFK